MTAAADYLWQARLPKVELHVRLEGAIPHDALWDLIQKHGGDPTCPDKQSLQRRFKYRDFPHFIDMWSWKNGFLREYAHERKSDLETPFVRDPAWDSIDNSIKRPDLP